MTAVDSGWFYIDDGSHYTDGSGHIGVRVVSSVTPSIGAKVAVTGISSTESMADSIIPVVRARRGSDVQIYD